MRLHSASKARLAYASRPLSTATSSFVSYCTYTLPSRDVSFGQITTSFTVPYFSSSSRYSASSSAKSCVVS